MLRTSLARTSCKAQRLALVPPVTSFSLRTAQSTSRLLPLPLACTRHSSQAISNPTLANIESRWEAMPLQEQADLWIALRDRMKVDWHELTPAEKKASYWIAFGPHGPRAEAPPGENMKLVLYLGVMFAVTFTILAIIHNFAGPLPKTMTQEWQEATNDYMKSENIEPITGVSSEGYQGKGMIQSKPSGKPLDD